MCRAVSAARRAEESVEDLSELGVEDGVDDGVKSAVDVAEPDEAGHDERVDAAQRRRAGARHVIARILTYTHRVDDVDGEERQPAEQKHRYTRAPTDTTRGQRVKNQGHAVIKYAVAWVACR